MRHYIRAILIAILLFCSQSNAYQSQNQKPESSQQQQQQSQSGQRGSKQSSPVMTLPADQQPPASQKPPDVQNVYIATPEKTTDRVERLINIVGVICMIFKPGRSIFMSGGT